MQYALDVDIAIRKTLSANKSEQLCWPVGPSIPCGNGGGVAPFPSVWITPLMDK